MTQKTTEQIGHKESERNHFNFCFGKFKKKPFYFAQILLDCKVFEPCPWTSNVKRCLSLPPFALLVNDENRSNNVNKRRYNRVTLKSTNVESFWQRCSYVYARFLSHFATLPEHNLCNIANGTPHNLLIIWQRCDQLIYCTVGESSSNVAITKPRDFGVTCMERWSLGNVAIIFPRDFVLFGVTQKTFQNLTKIFQFFFQKNKS